MHGPSAGKNRAVGQGDGKSVEVDSAVIDQRAKGAVPRQRPGAALFDGKSNVAGNRRAALGVFIDVQGAGKVAVLRKIQSQGRDGIHQNVSRKSLPAKGTFYLCPVAAGGTPATAGGVAADAHKCA